MGDLHSWVIRGVLPKSDPCGRPAAISRRGRSPKSKAELRSPCVMECKAQLSKTSFVTVASSNFCNISSGGEREALGPEGFGKELLDFLP